MRIAICDEESLFRYELHSIIVEYKRNKRFQIDIAEFESGEELLSSEMSFDIIFLGYRLPHADGMQIARKLRAKNIPCDIVFVTNYPDFVYEAFEVHPYRFFTKPINRDEIHSMLDSFISQQKSIFPITVAENGEHRIISSKDIVYLEGDGKHCIIRTTTETLYSSKTLSEVFACLPHNSFFRTHRSYAVNMRYISMIDSKYILFSNGEKASISRAYLGDFKKAFEDFLDNFYLKV